MFGKLTESGMKKLSQSFWMSDWSIQRNMTNVKYKFNSLYCGHPRDRQLVSLTARVRNSGNFK